MDVAASNRTLVYNLIRQAKENPALESNVRKALMNVRQCLFDSIAIINIASESPPLPVKDLKPPVKIKKNTPKENNNMEEIILRQTNKVFTLPQLSKIIGEVGKPKGLLIGRKERRFKGDMYQWLHEHWDLIGNDFIAYARENFGE